MNLDSTDKSIVIFGAGKMGCAYARTVPEITRTRLTVVEPDKNARCNFKKQFPDISISDKLVDEDRLLAIVASSTPAHLENMQELAALSVPPRAILVEKPLITAHQLHVHQSMLSKILESFEQGYCSYLIEFSSAVSTLQTFMLEFSLRVYRAEALWQKNRRGDLRPTMGDLEDEMTHPLSLLIALSQVNQAISSVGIKASLQYEPYTSAESQEKLRLRYPSVSLTPNSSSSLELLLTPEGESLPIPLTLSSSFVACTQVRSLTIQLARDGEDFPRYEASLLFDRLPEGSDLLVIQSIDKEKRKIRPRLMSTNEFSRENKLEKQLQAVLDVAVHSRRDPRLKDLLQALKLVELSLLATQSHERNETVITSL